MASNPWAILGTWLHVEAPQEIQEKWIYNPFWTKSHNGITWSRALMYLLLPKSLWKMKSTYSKIKIIKNDLFLQELPKLQMTHFGPQGISSIYLFIFTHKFTWCNLWHDHLDLTLKFSIFWRKFTISIVLEFWVKTPNQTNFTQLLLTDLKARFEPCMVNLI